jgi:hypothetical protein
MGEVFNIPTSGNKITIPVAYAAEEVKQLEKYAVIMAQIDMVDKSGNKKRILQNATVDELIKEAVRNFIAEFNIVGKQILAQQQQMR